MSHASPQRCPPNRGKASPASEPVAVYPVSIDTTAGTSAAFTALSTSLLGTNYYLISRPASLEASLAGQGFSEFTIVPTISNTTVTITPSAGADLMGRSGSNYTEILQPGQAYQINSRSNLDDVTGTLISSSQPIAVFAGANVAYVPNTNTQSGNPLIQEQIPLEDWGTNVLAVSFAGRSGGDTYRVLPAQSGTYIYTNGVLAASNLSAGTPFDTNIDGAVQFTANKPIQVAHFANGRDFDPADEGDPCEVLLPPADHYLETNIVFSFGTTVASFDENFLNLIAPQSAISNTFLDYANIPATNFTQIGSSGYYFYRVPVGSASAVHRVTSSQPVGVEPYGWGNFDAYGYISGVVK